MVAYLTKSDAREGFNQVIDFLNGSYIKYSLTVNPNIYVSCIKQFWNTVVIKQDNGVTRLQALVNKKKVVITEAGIREVLQLDDAERVDCLPTKRYLQSWHAWSMSAKRTLWHEFSSAIVSAVICLSTGKGFSGVETPLFEGMIVEQVIQEEGDEEAHVEADTAAQGDDAQESSIPSPTPPTPPPQHLKIFHQHPRRVEHLEYDKVAQALEITKLKRRVKKLEKGNMVKVLKLQRLKKVGTSQRVNTSKDTMMDDASNQGRKLDALDKDDAVFLMDDEEEDKKDEEVKVVEDDQVQGRQAESQAKIYKINVDHALKVLKVVTTASEIVTTACTIIFAAEPQVPAATITAAPVRVTVASTRRRKGVVIRDP
uniref:Xylulose kinase-1 n=1 Tax=Tanacetum cinerariifolium TaxID=118510 RepID=A0A699KK62_TANCI|nr:xylulose kinase-1 [Tanacetum cinerariifolium]